MQSVCCCSWQGLQSDPSRPGFGHTSLARCQQEFLHTVARVQTRIFRKVRKPLAVVVISRTRRSRQRTLGRQPHIAVRIANPIRDRRPRLELLANCRIPVSKSAHPVPSRQQSLTKPYRCTVCAPKECPATTICLIFGNSARSSKYCTTASSTAYEDVFCE